MKRIINSTAVIIPMVAAMFFSTSCIYDAPGDKFYRTLWKSSPEPFYELSPMSCTSDESVGNPLDTRCSYEAASVGTLDEDSSFGTAGLTATMVSVRFASEVGVQSEVGSIIVEFLCDRKITVKNAAGTIIAHGTYTPDGTTAIFADLAFYLGDIRITLTQAHRNGDTLFLQWQTSTQRTTRTTSLDRLSAYE